MTKDEVFDLINDAGFGFLATTEGNQPRVRPMMPYLADDGELLLAAISGVRTIEQIRKNPMVEICYVDRKMSYCRIAGKASLSNDAAKKELVWNNIPMLRQYFSGPNDPKFNLIIIDPKTVEVMTTGHKTPELVNIN